MMKKALAIACKELAGYFKSPIAYITLIVTISVFNIFFFIIIDTNREATLRDIFKLMEFMFIFIIPILTMRAFAEEQRAGTIEFLMTCPVKKSSIVLGKYLGTALFFTFIIGLTFAYYIILEFFAQPDRMATLSGYLGLWLEGMLFIAIGMVFSSLTKNQLVAALNSYVVLLLLYFSVALIKYLPTGLGSVVTYVGFWSHAQNFASGFIARSDLVYCASGIALCLIITRIIIEQRAGK